MSIFAVCVFVNAVLKHKIAAIWERWRSLLAVDTALRGDRYHANSERELGLVACTQQKQRIDLYMARWVW